MINLQVGDTVSFSATILGLNGTYQAKKFGVVVSINDDCCTVKTVYGHHDVVKIDAVTVLGDLPLTHRIDGRGIYEIGYFGPGGFVKTGEVGTMARAKEIVDSFNAEKGFI